jgi:hypothetical protein
MMLCFKMVPACARFDSDARFFDVSSQCHEAVEAHISHRFTWREKYSGFNRIKTMEKQTHKYILVENKIKEAIRHREIVDKLPGERVLAKEFGVSYMTIRKAVENLVSQGILYKVPARGTYVDQRGTVKRMVNRLGYFFETGLR